LEQKIVYDAFAVGTEVFEATATYADTLTTNNIHVSTYLDFNSSILEAPTQQIFRSGLGFRVGQAIAVSADGSIFASSESIKWDSPDFQSAVTNATGTAKVYKKIGDTYIQLGNDITGQARDRLGYRVALSDDGKRIALSTYHVSGFDDAPPTDYVIVYAYDEATNSWNPVGDKILFDGQGFGSGGVDINSLDLNFNGSVLAVGNTREPIEGFSYGAAFVFEFDESANTWVQKGSTLNPKTVGSFLKYSEFGRDLDLNKAGDVLVVSHPLSINDQSIPGFAYVFKFNAITSEWELMGQPIQGTNSVFNGFGSSVAINDLGNRIVIGENYEEIGNSEIILGKAYAYAYDYASRLIQVDI
jgi:hypothetical protein